MRKLYFATGNKGKAGEAQFILGRDIEIASLELDEIQSSSLKKIVTHKLNQAYSILKKPVMVDDVSLELDAWDKFPGPFVKYMHGGDNKRFLKIFENVENRNGTLIATIGYHDGKKTHCFTGKIRITISHKEKGSGGWGLDAVLIPEAYRQTFAEMGEETKNAISHRRKALLMLKRFLDSKKSKNDI